MLDDDNADVLMDVACGEVHTELHKIKGYMLCADEAGIDPIAVQHFCLAIDAINTAMHNLNLAKLHQTRALAALKSR